MWPPAALDFLRDLEANNDRDWFKANRDRYNADLLAPTRALAEQLSDLGQPYFFRPWNNTRFRPGPPLKEHIALTLGAGNAVYYLQLSLDGLVVGAGLHHPATDQLERFRAAMTNDRTAAAFERAVDQARKGGLELVEPELKRAPKGYSPDHPRIERLRLKRMTLFHHHELKPWLHTRACDTRIRRQFESATPFVKWMSETVGPSTLPSR
jgi:uncharacterized protein (TIGR02453 family)